jgi:YD repeat-containing protein
MPEGTKGWTYFISLNKIGYVSTPHEACVRSAANHWRVTLDRMSPSAHPKPIFECIYRNPVGGLQYDYTHTYLICQDGYTPKSPGGCVKWSEPARPQSCAADEPGYAVGNPVVVSSGAKIQTEVDLQGTPAGTLRIVRTYRTLRDGGAGQSAGQGWSFSFDRNFQTVFSLNSRPGDPPRSIVGSFGDGASFEFYRLDSGLYVSKYDKRESIRSLNGAFTDWVLTTRDGSIERFTKVKGKFLLVSSHTYSGTEQVYSYDADNRLSTIADASGRTVTVTWSNDTVLSIFGPTARVRYGYGRTTADGGSEIIGTEQLESVEFYDGDGREIAVRRYHYENADQRYLLTGITDENGIRFATYAYNLHGQAILSEHAGGVNRYTFEYPNRDKRVITDPLGTSREFDLTYEHGSGGLVTSTNQPAGAGCGPGSSKLT